MLQISKNLYLLKGELPDIPNQLDKDYRKKLDVAILKVLGFSDKEIPTVEKEIIVIVREWLNEISQKNK